MVGELKYVCLSRRKGTVKNVVTAARLKHDYGLEGDAHAGLWHRQVSLLDEADINGMRALGLKLKPGAFGENLVVAGMELAKLGIGSRLTIGGAILELTQIGKVCHTRCAIYQKTGDCIMPRLGLFARVVRGGELRSGMKVKVAKEVPRDKMQAAVLTVSDRCAAGVTRDTAGPAVAALLSGRLQANIAWTGIVPDELEQIITLLKNLAARGLDLVVTVGGTGFSPRDVTPEATRAIIQREAPGLAEAMRLASAKITPNAWLQRGVCGIYESSIVINLPGSQKAAVENLTAVVEVMPHAVQQVRLGAPHAEAADRKTGGLSRRHWSHSPVKTGV